MSDSKEPKAKGMKNIYKKSLAIELIKKGHDFSHSMRNKHDKRFQVYVFHETPELLEDLRIMTEQLHKKRGKIE